MSFSVFSLFNAFPYTLFRLSCHFFPTDLDKIFEHFDVNFQPQFLFFFKSSETREKLPYVEWLAAFVGKTSRINCWNLTSHMKFQNK